MESKRRMIRTTAYLVFAVLLVAVIPVSARSSAPEIDLNGYNECFFECRDALYEGLSGLSGSEGSVKVDFQCGDSSRSITLKAGTPLPSLSLKCSSICGEMNGI